MNKPIFKAATAEQIAKRPKVSPVDYDDIFQTYVRAIASACKESLDKMIFDVLTSNGVPREYLKADIQSCHAATNSQQAKA